jgi:integrase
MGTKRKMPGLKKRGNTWHIHKQFKGYLIRESCRTEIYEEAEAYLIHPMHQIRDQLLFGVFREPTFEEASVRYIEEENKKSLERDAQNLSSVMPWIGQLPLRQVHFGTLTSFVQHQRSKGIKSGTVNRQLSVVRRVLRLCATRYYHQNGEPWLPHLPEIPPMLWSDKRNGYPLSEEEYSALVSCMPSDLRHVAEFMVNTGIRGGELCELRWSWRRTTCKDIFDIPGSVTKNNRDKVLVCNKAALGVLDQMSSNGTSEFVFPGKGGQRRAKIAGSAWYTARRRATDLLEQRTGQAVTEGFMSLRPHDFRHTFATRLRKQGVTNETRKALMGHVNGDVTTMYSQAELDELRWAVSLLETQPDVASNVVWIGTKAAHVGKR